MHHRYGTGRRGATARGWRGRVGSILAVAVTLAASGCISARPEQVTIVPPDPTVATRPIYVATTRIPAADNLFVPGIREQLSFYQVAVSVPPTHRGARIEEPRARPDPSRTFAITNQQAIDRKTIVGALAKQQNVGVFVHGHHVTYEESVFRVAQIIRDTIGTTLSSPFTAAGRLLDN